MSAPPKPALITLGITSLFTLSLTVAIDLRLSQLFSIVYINEILIFLRFSFSLVVFGFCVLS